MMTAEQGRSSLSADDIGNQARFLLAEFVRQRLQAAEPNVRIDDDLLMSRDAPRGPELHQVREVAAALRRIGDELDGDHHLQMLIQKLSLENPQQSFLSVAHDMFSDGIYNWGRIVTLFYFAFKMVLKALANNIYTIIKNIIEWVVQFIVDSVAMWIIGRGGWESIQEHFGATQVQIAAVLFSAVVVCALIYWKSTKK